MSELFETSTDNIWLHLKNIFNEWELQENTTTEVFSVVQNEWNRRVKRNIKMYNFDAIISVGYRITSKKATEFRIWATNILKNYLTKGFVINKNRLQQKWLDELQKTLEIFQKTLSNQNLRGEEATGLLEIITKYTNSWLLLQKYDENSLVEKGNTNGINYKLEAKEAYESLLELKNDLKNKNQATEFFANPRENNVLEWIFGNIYQTFDSAELYTTIEEKAANLLYFIVKNHPFLDGNKRSGAFLFILFLAKNNILFDENNERKINDRALVAITLLIAESNPKDKEIMVKLVINLIK